MGIGKVANDLRRGKSAKEALVGGIKDSPSHPDRGRERWVRTRGSTKWGVVFEQEKEEGKLSRNLCY